MGVHIHPFMGDETAAVKCEELIHSAVMIG
jgi:hypothetical protein